MEEGAGKRCSECGPVPELQVLVYDILPSTLPASDDRGVGQSLCSMPYFTVETMPFHSSQGAGKRCSECGVLAESEKRILWEPRVTESGRETVEGFMEDKKGNRRASVLSSLSLSRCSVIHVLMSSVHALRSLLRLGTSLKRADF